MDAETMYKKKEKSLKSVRINYFKPNNNGNVSKKVSMSE